MADKKVLRIGVFYDGNYFFHVSRYYRYYHQRKSYLSVPGIHNFVKGMLAEFEDVDPKFCQIIDAHYFRGRIKAKEAGERDLLLRERQFDEVLIRYGITTHYLPIGERGEKGIDVWFALECFELAVLKKFDVCVIFAGDSDYLPLIRKLNTLGVRVMLLGWDFSFVDDRGEEKETRTSQSLIDEATYPILMSSEIDDRSKKHDSLINNLFISKGEEVPTSGKSKVSATQKEENAGTILNVKEGFGFIQPYVGTSTLFFHSSEVWGVPFEELRPGMKVRYGIRQDGLGRNLAVNVEVIS